MPHSYSKDGYLHVGMKIMLSNAKTRGFIAIDIGDRIEGVDEAYACTTTSKPISAVTRSIFNIEQGDLKEAPKDGIVKYGMKIKIVTNPYIFHKPLYLRSLPQSQTHFARFSRKQEVSLQAADDYYNMWIVEHIDPNVRFKSEGLPVKVNEPILLKHCSTDHHLASHLVEYKNDFGVEYEICCSSFLTLNKSQHLNLEKQGLLTKDHSTKFTTEENTWYFVTSDDPTKEQVAEVISLVSLVNTAKKTW